MKNISPGLDFHDVYVLQHVGSTDEPHFALRDKAADQRGRLQNFIGHQVDVFLDGSIDRLRALESGWDSFDGGGNVT